VRRCCWDSAAPQIHCRYADPAWFYENLHPFSPVMIAPRMRMLERTHCRFCMKRIPDDALPPLPARDKAVQVHGPTHCALAERIRGSIACLLRGRCDGHDIVARARSAVASSEILARRVRWAATLAKCRAAWRKACRLPGRLQALGSLEHFGELGDRHSCVTRSAKP